MGGRTLSPRMPRTRPLVGLCECGFRAVVLERLAELEEAYIAQNDVHRRYVQALERG
jgi:hypothetical protein